jgi:hypothetical protein
MKYEVMIDDETQNSESIFVRSNEMNKGKFKTGKGILLFFSLVLCMLPLGAIAQFTFSQSVTEFYNSRFIGSEKPKQHSYLWPYKIAATDPMQPQAQTVLATEIRDMILQRLDTVQTGSPTGLNWTDIGGGKEKTEIDINGNLKFRPCVFLEAPDTCEYDDAIPLVVSLQVVNMRVEVIRNSGANDILDAYPIGVPSTDIDTSVHTEVEWKKRKLNLPALSIAGQRVSFCDKSSVAVTDPSSSDPSARARRVGVCDSGTGYYKFDEVNAEKAVLINTNTRFDLAEPKSDSELRLHVFNVGAGNCAILECPAKTGKPGVSEAIILDCGVQGKLKNTIKDADEYIFRDTFFNLLNTKTHFDMVTSHSDEDHYSILGEWYKGDDDFNNLFKTKLRNTYMGGAMGGAKGSKSDIGKAFGYKINSFAQKMADIYQARKQGATPTAGDIYLMDARTATPTTVEFVAPTPRGGGTGAAPHLGATPGSTKELLNENVVDINIACGDATVKFLAANSVPDRLHNGRAEEINSQSIITYIEFDGKKLLMAADAGGVSLEAAVKNAASPSLPTPIDIQNLNLLSVPHHGSEADYHYHNHKENTRTNGFNDKSLIGGQHNFQAWVKPKNLLYQAGGAYHMPFDRSYYSYKHAFPLAAGDSTLDSIAYKPEGHKYFHFFSPGKKEYGPGGQTYSESETNPPSNMNIRRRVEHDRAVYVSSDNGDIVVSIKKGQTMTTSCLGPFQRAGLASKSQVNPQRFDSLYDAYNSSLWCVPE